MHQMLKDELDLDGRPNLNLASFVGTYMEREAEALMVENLSKKYVAHHENVTFPRRDIAYWSNSLSIRGVACRTQMNTRR